MNDVRETPLALHLPLTGMQLVEASAGTGKTHTLVLLLLRAIVVDGCDPAELIAVTFTRAAAGELRERVRAALAHAARRAADPHADVPAHLAEPIDAMIALALERDAAVGRPMLARRLRAAELAVDVLWMGTLHAICQRLLAEFGPTLGVPGIDEEVDAGKELFETACADAWRVAHADPDLPGLAIELLPTPRELAALLEPVIAMPPASLLPDRAPPAQALAAGRSDFEAAWRAARATAGDAATLIAAIADRERHAIKLTSVSDAAIADAQRLIDGYFAMPPGSTRLPAGLQPFAAGNLAQARNSRKKNAEPLPDHPLPAALETLMAAESSWLALLRVALVHRLHADVRERIAGMTFEQGRARFDDLVLRVSDLLAGPQSARFVALARSRWRLALIDEFQDTDAEQYAVFSALFGDRLVMVGDPKQAIYRFRGGDVYAYQRARQQADGLARLSVCRRAEQALVDAVNALFDGGRIAQPFPEPFIAYEPVECGYDGRRHGELTLRGKPGAGLCLWPVADAAGGSWSNKDEPRRQVISALAQEIVDLLDPGRRAAQLVFDDAERPLKPGDIAVLCQTRDECAAVAVALRRRGVPVSVGTDPDVEWWAGEDVRRLLAAWLAPLDGRRIRALLLSGLHGLTLDRLPDGSDSGPLSDERLAAFARQARWANGGELGRAVLDAVRQGAAAAAGLPDGDMRVDAWLRMADRLVQWSLPGHGLHAVHARFHRWREERSREQEAMRTPESGDAVRVMTIHASKGLEFGVVFAPFLWSQRDPRRNRGGGGLAAVRFHDEAGRLRVDIGSESLDRHRQVAEEEEIAEGVRKAYVAVTRARHRLYLPVAVTKNGWVRSPLAHLLPGIDAATGAGLEAALFDLSGSTPGAIEVGAMPEASAPGPQCAIQTPAQKARTLSRRPRDDFRLMSYSRLVRSLGDDARDAGQALIEGRTPYDDGEPDRRLRGAAFGSCFHALMEAATSGENDPAVLARIAATHGFAGGHERAYLQQLVDDTLDAELPGGRRLRGLGGGDHRAEMEFFVPMRRFGARALGELLTAHEAYRRPAERWSSLPETVHGYLRGFIDLVYRVDGRYYVLDYKTNDLGADPAAYAVEALRDAIRRHDYDLQYLIYLVALQRLLRDRLGDAYCPRTHLGGAVYVFVRGLRAGAGVYFDRPPQALVDRLENVLCGDVP